MAATDGYRESEVDPVLGQAAAECAAFYNGPRSWNQAMFGGAALEGAGPHGTFPEPDFKVSINKTFEFVSIFGPALYYENPVRTVKPRVPASIPADFFSDVETWAALMRQEDLRIRMDGLRGVLLESYLNWTPREFGLDRESRLAIDEALIKGRGTLWVELYRPPGSPIKVVKSQWESVDDFLIDPDATGLRDATWIARRRCQPTWLVERDYGLRRGSVRGNCESLDTRAMIGAGPDASSLEGPDWPYERKRGLTNDLVVFYQVWSKMGLGGRLWNQPASYRAATDVFGDYCYLVLADAHPFPFNCPPDVSSDPSFGRDPRAVFARFAWPTPFWYDDGWPVQVLDFHAQHRCTWPLPHLRSGMGELKFLQWVWSFLMGHIRTTTRDF